MTHQGDDVERDAASRNASGHDAAWDAVPRDAASRDASGARRPKPGPRSRDHLIWVSFRNDDIRAAAE